ncbi:MAG: hypothetical protein ACAH07_06615 [Methylophilaceae bacterium]|nr:hypothetical protein [Methyloradius sp.]
MPKRKLTYIFCCLIFISACSPAPDNTPKIAEGARNVLDKAKTVNATVQQNTEDTKKKIDAESE